MSEVKKEVDNAIKLLGLSSEVTFVSEGAELIEHDHDNRCGHVHAI